MYSLANFYKLFVFNFLHVKLKLKVFSISKQMC